MSNLRTSNIAKLQSQIFDVLIVGGGINGAVSAAALAAKGAKVAMIDKGDFASHTSSNSSNLAWGGIKYLESGEFLLVNKLCKSRNHLMRSYPASVKEIRFLTSIQKGFRLPAFALYLGTLLYWLVGRCFTRPPVFLRSRNIKRSEPVVNTEHVQGGFEYSDAYLHDNDARFVFGFVRSAMSYGCIAANYVESLGSERQCDHWLTRVKDGESGQNMQIRAKMLINAAGPFVDQLNHINQVSTHYHHLFSKGIHLVVDRVTPHRKVLTFFASDGRLFFVLPMGPKTCIGTTDTQVDTPSTEVTAQDRQFVLDNVNRCLDLPTPITLSDIISQRCGVRPLAIKGTSGQADWVKLSRKHVVETCEQQQHVSIFGGKLTDCINVGNEIANKVRALGIELPYADKKWYGEPPASIRDEFMHRAKLMDLDALTPATSHEPLSQRFWRRYNRNALNMLEQIRENPSMAERLIEHAEYLRVEIEHAARREMITKLDDFLRRRSKIAQVVDTDSLLSCPGLFEACQILFGDQAEQKLQEYRDTVKPTKS